MNAIIELYKHAVLLPAAYVSNQTFSEDYRKEFNFDKPETNIQI